MPWPETGHPPDPRHRAVALALAEVAGNSHWPRARTIIAPRHLPAIPRIRRPGPACSPQSGSVRRGWRRIHAQAVEDTSGREGRTPLPPTHRDG